MFVDGDVQATCVLLMHATADCRCSCMQVKQTERKLNAGEEVATVLCTSLQRMKCMEV